MRTPIRLPGRTRFLSPLAAAGLAASLLSPLAAAAPVVASPLRHAATLSAAPVPAVAARPMVHGAAALAAPQGPVTGVSCTPSCDLWAETGLDTSLPGGPAAGVPVWGYNTVNASVAAPGGPTIVVNQGDAVSIVLHNANLPVATSLMIAGQPGVPDTLGIPAGSSTTYTFAAGSLNPGTYLYEAGLTNNATVDGALQAAMGLFGALVVRPAANTTTTAYGGTNTAFDDEAVLVLSEIDPALNQALTTSAPFDPSYESPTFWLINGKVYPNTDPIATAPGRNVLLRYVNAGLQPHSMSLLGLHQTIVATDGTPSTNQTRVVAETVPAGGTLDTIVAMPASAPAGTQFALYEAAMHLDNNGVRTTTSAASPITFGGMLTFLTTGTGTPLLAGPVTSGLSLSPNPTSGPGGTAPGPVTLSGTIGTASDPAIDGAEYFVDVHGADGTGCPITIGLGAAPASVSISVPTSGGTAPCTDLTTLTSGNHTFFVHGHNLNGWGSVSSAVLSLDTTGPAVSGMKLTPSLDNGTADVALQATASDVATGNQNVIAAEYFIDPVGTPAPGTGTAIAIATPTTVVSLSATIVAATVAGLSEGPHNVAVRAEDSFGNWGALGTLTLTVDKTGPNTSGVTAQPNPNNGTLGVQVTSGGAYYVRIDATVADPIAGGVSSNITAAEYFFDTVGADGTGGAMIPTDGAYNSPTEAAYGAVDLIHVAALTNGSHTVYVHGKDAAGNWGPTSSISFVIDRTPPVISALGTTPSPANLAATVTLSITAADPANAGTPPATNAPASNIVGGEYFWGTADPGVGLGTAFTLAPATSGGFSTIIDVSTRTIFTNNTLSVRVKDAAGNWSTVSTTVIAIDRVFANTFPTSAAPYGWSATGGNAARLSLRATANMTDAGTNALAASVATGTSGYVVNTLAAAQTSYRARFYVNPNGATLGTATPTIFAAMHGATTVFAVQMRLNAGSYQVRLVGTANSSWYVITGATAIEVARSGGLVSLYTGGTLRQTVSVATTGIGAARLGLSAGITTGMNGSTVYFDGFVSSRTTPIGL